MEPHSRSERILPHAGLEPRTCLDTTIFLLLNVLSLINTPHTFPVKMWTNSIYNGLIMTVKFVTIFAISKFCLQSAIAAMHGLHSLVQFGNKSSFGPFW